LIDEPRDRDRRQPETIVAENGRITAVGANVRDATGRAGSSTSRALTKAAAWSTRTTISP
jgi:hypothetical protein